MVPCVVGPCIVVPCVPVVCDLAAKAKEFCAKNDASLTLSRLTSKLRSIVCDLGAKAKEFCAKNAASLTLMALARPISIPCSIAISHDDFMPLADILRSKATPNNVVIRPLKMVVSHLKQLRRRRAVSNLVALKNVYALVLEDFEVQDVRLIDTSAAPSPPKWPKADTRRLRQTLH